MSFRLPTGAVPSSDDPRDFDFADLFTSAGAGPGTKWPTIDCTGIHERRVQGQPSCVGYTLWTQIQDFDLQLWALNREVRVLQPTGGIVMRPRRALPPLPLLSGQWGYTGARWLEAKLLRRAMSSTDGLPNGGSSYRLNIMWGRDVANGGGARAETDWPDVPENATRLPPAHVLQAEPFVQIGRYYRIFGEKNADRLRDGWCQALRGFEQGICSKPGSVMPVGPGYEATKEGDVYDGDPRDVFNHAQTGGGYDADQDALVLHSTWPGADTYRVRTQRMADVGCEFWVFNGLIYIPRAAA